MSASHTSDLHPLLADRTAGVLLHPTSLPSTDAAFGIGDLGPTARRFADWASTAGLRRWQMLPIGPVGDDDCPYSARSSFAIEPMLASVADLVEDGFLPASAARIGRADRAVDDGGRASWRRARKWKRPRLEAAFRAFEDRRGRMGLRGAAYEAFRSRTKDWLDDWCGYASNPVRNRRPNTEIDCEPTYHAFLQFILDRQWSRLRAHARERGVHLVGDLPIFCPPDSADVQSRPDLFRIDRDGVPTVLTGVPPSPDPTEESNSVWGRTAVDHGQLWGHPHYKWKAHRSDDWAWWRSRIRCTLGRFDILRIDHFIGFHNAFEISTTTSDPATGRWRRTPGDELLASIAREIGRLPFIVEDLGDRTPPIDALRERFGLFGMRILQSAFFDNAEAAGELPCNHPPRCVVYPGTHDNHTAAGWYRSVTAETRRRFQDYAGPSAAKDPAEAMTRLAFTSPANIAIVQMQDFLGLGGGDRMNRPGEATGNWCWRMRRSDANAPLARRLADLASASKRLP